MKLDYKQIREDNMAALLAIRDNPDTPQAVKIQAIQSIQKIRLETAPAADNAVNEADILKRIRAAKK